jgi:hypothetical protein
MRSKENARLLCNKSEPATRRLAARDADKEEKEMERAAGVAASSLAWRQEGDCPGCLLQAPAESGRGHVIQPPQHTHL